MAYGKSNIENSNSGTKFIYFKSIAVSLLFSMIILLIVAAIITYTSVPESVLPIVTSIVMIISIAFSGMLTAINKKRNGLIQGLITGAIYTLIILVLGWLMLDGFSFDKFMLGRSLIGVFSGGIGGMIGVNFK